MKCTRSYEGITISGVLWPFSTVMNPAVNLGQMCPVENGSGDFSEALVTVDLWEPVSSPCHAPQLAGTLLTDWTC